MTSTGHDELATPYATVGAILEQCWGPDLHHGLWPADDERIDIEEASTRLTDVVLAHVLAVRPRRVLDVGCGYGRVAVRAAERGGAEVTGIDVNEAAVDRARRLASTSAASDRLSFHVGRVEEFRPDDGFDVVMAVEATLHLDLDSFFAAATRLLNPGGRVVLQATTASEPLTAEDNTLLRDYFRLFGFARLTTFDDYLVALRRHGFRLLRFEDIAPRVNPPTFRRVADNIARDEQRLTRRFGPDPVRVAHDLFTTLADFPKTGSMILECAKG